ncbi:MAG: AAA family ATPase [Planctomycetes bacterium]|nr:AAA family ATPase [Planctomycetota bacterium]
MPTRPAKQCVLLTGMSGVGKSALVAELVKRGFEAIDMDEPGWSRHDENGHQLWNEDKLAEALAGHQAGTLFVSGCAENQVKFYAQFSQIILLSAPAEVIRQRLANRTSNTFGKSPEQLAYVMDHLKWLEPRLRQSATHEISTVPPLGQVVDQLLALLRK